MREAVKKLKGKRQGRHVHRVVPTSVYEDYQRLTAETTERRKYSPLKRRTCPRDEGKCDLREVEKAPER